MKYKDFEDFMQMKHAEQFIGTKDGMIDDFQSWTEDLDLDDWFKYGDQYAKLKVAEHEK